MPPYTSWATAATSLQDALELAVSGDEVWVAQGTYTPDPDATATDYDRDASFILREGLRLYGGFDGTELTDADRDQRDYANNLTILSGDLLGDDQTRRAGQTGFQRQPHDNAYHVLIAAAADVWIDGFTVSGGQADGTGSFLGIFGLTAAG